MSFEAIVHRAAANALAAHPLIRAQVNRVGDGEGEGAPAPAAWIGDCAGSEWGAKDRPGREARLALTVADRGDGARLARLVAAAETALTAMPRRLDDWETGGVVISRVRLTRRRDGLRLALIDIRVRGWPAQ